jgi:hypothetical protein
MPVKAMDFESIASANSARGPANGIVAAAMQKRILPQMKIRWTQINGRLAINVRYFRCPFGRSTSVFIGLSSVSKFQVINMSGRTPPRTATIGPCGRKVSLYGCGCMVETCTQCGGAIGEVGTPYVWKDRIVCAACNSRLRAGRGGTAAPSAGVATVVAPAPAQVRTAFYAGATGRHMQCVVVGCGYRGPAVETREYSRPLAVILLSFGIIPGVIYLLLHRTVNIRCPRCGATVDADRPEE